MGTVDFAKALADETRQKIMQVCCCQKMSVTEIVAEIQLTQPTVSHHLKVLRDAGLVTVERRGKEIYYSLNQDKVARACCQVAGTFAPGVPVAMVQGCKEEDR